MKILRVETLIACGTFAESSAWAQSRKALHLAIRRVVWPSGSDKFTIFPQSGKKRGEGNGVKPIKDGLMLQLKDLGWRLEVPLEISSHKRPGNLDAVLDTLYGPVAVEWETGNVSSSHRALNKMALGLATSRDPASSSLRYDNGRKQVLPQPESRNPGLPSTRFSLLVLYPCPPR